MCERTMTERVLSYIEDNLSRDLTLERISRELNYSKFYMERTFKRNTGLTIYKYIQRRRLEEAAGKLAGTAQPIIEIALEAGYSSQQAFTQAFRCEYGYAPQEYRRMGELFPKKTEILSSSHFRGERMAA